MGKKSKTPSSTTSTVTNTTQLSPQQQALLGAAVPIVQSSLQSSNLIPYQGSLVAPTSPEQQTGQQLALGAAERMAPTIGNTLAGLNFTQGPGLFVSSNPAMQDAIGAAIRPLMQNYMQNVIPNIRMGAAFGGQSGSSRAGVAEGIATQSLFQQMGDTAATMANQGYQTGLDALVRGMALAPQTVGMTLMPSQIYDAVGLQRQQQQQAVLDAERARFYENKFLPLTMAQNAASMAFGMPGTGVASSTAPTGIRSPSPIASGLGGAAAGYALGSALPFASGGPIGAGIGALLGILG